ncbi:MAG TPA: sigma 54-interacting transcriptional regulator, partial [Candidatus Angelobacter sp.]|nr:sigma 54-interacting transcriptional regulator [Candidatus Angelobacter sp.]
GTLLIDEVGELDLSLQAKLLRVLETGKVTPVGSTKEKPVDVRVLAATNINMAAAIANKSFREDLYYRLSSFVLNMPSLRDRKEEIPMMLRHFMIQVAEKYACPLLPISPRLVKACESYPWPGNIREMENFVKRYLVLGDENAAVAELERGSEPAPEPLAVTRPAPPNSDLKQMVKSLKNGAEMEAIANALEENAWNRKRAASVLNISYKALLYKIRQYDIRPRRDE